MKSREWDLAGRALAGGACALGRAQAKRAQRPGETPSPRPLLPEYPLTSAMLLYYPMGLEELRLAYDAGMRAFPPRPPAEPTFCPVLTEARAIEVARDRSITADDRAGFVTRFSVGNEYLMKLIGNHGQEALCLAAEDLAELNRQLEGTIAVIATFFGEGYVGHVPEHRGLRGKNATEQFLALLSTVGDSGFYMACDMTANSVPVFLNFFYWEQEDFTPKGITRGHRDLVLGDLRRVWACSKTGSVPLGVVR